MEHTVASVVQMDVAAGRVWKILDDFGRVEDFSVGVAQSSLVGDLPTGLGAKRRCVFHDNSSVLEEIVAYDPNRGFTVELSEFTMPMKSMSASFRVDPCGESRCQVSMQMRFEVKWGVFGSVMGMVLMRPAMKRVQKTLLSGLAYHAATGNLIGRELPAT